MSKKCASAWSRNLFLFSGLVGMLVEVLVSYIIPLSFITKSHVLRTSDTHLLPHNFACSHMVAIRNWFEKRNSNHISIQTSTILWVIDRWTWTWPIPQLWPWGRRTSGARTLWTLRARTKAHAHTLTLTLSHANHSHTRAIPNQNTIIDEVDANYFEMKLISNNDNNNKNNRNVKMKCRICLHCQQSLHSHKIFSFVYFSDTNWK